METVAPGSLCETAGFSTSRDAWDSYGAVVRTGKALLTSTTTTLCRPCGPSCLLKVHVCSFLAAM